MKLITVTTIAILALSPVAASAQASVQGQINAGAQRSTLVTHCAGLLHSVFDYLGEAQLGQKKSNEIKRDMTTLLNAGAAYRVEERGGSSKQAGKFVTAAAFKVSTAYFKRYKSNVQKTGNAFKGDRSWNSDLGLCNGMVKELS